MADRTENVHVNFDDDGSLNKLNKDAAGVKANLEGAAKASERVAGPVAAMRNAGSASTSAMKSANTAAGVVDPRGAAAADSNTARGVAGQTGAAGRDFAAQARGLGGLVHVYATFAANIFALSAAFTALSKAANITNMVKGLDQLGAAAGKNLGTVAKSLTMVTDGALSLADAMTAVSQASAGGMSSENILRMGEVAKKASQALGRDMPDAMNRLSRGITKLEPELLDELGIMVKIDESNRNYARSLGKSVSALSDFEKRQGYANAVLEEGERKFGALKLDSSPYQKILASVINLSVKIGELINNALGPMLELLSKSPTALAAALGLIATTLLKQAIPAITQWRNNLEAATTTARNAAIEANKQRTSKRSLKDINEAVAFEDKRAASIERTVTAYAALEENTRKTVKTARLLREVTLEKVTEEQIKALEKQEKARGKLTLMDDAASAASKRRQAAAMEEAKQIKALTAALRELLLIQEEEKVIYALPKNSIAKAKGYFSNDSVNDRIADRLVGKSQQANILGSVSSNFNDKGMKQSFKDLFASIGNARKGITDANNSFADGAKKMWALNAASTALKGSLTILAQGFTTLLASMTAVIFYVGLAIAAFQILDSIFSTNSKQAEKFSSSLDTLNGAIENAGRTIDAIDSKGLDKIISIESTNAIANAFYELTNSIGTTVKAYKDLEKASSWWDDSIDWIKKVLPFFDSAGEKLSKVFTQSLSSSVKLLEGSSLEEEAKNTIERIFGLKNVDIRNPEALQKAIDKLGLSYSVLVSKATESEEALKKLSAQMSNRASALNSFQAGLVETAKLVDDMNNALLPKDDVGKIGIQMINNSKNLAIALKDPVDALKAIKRLSEDLKTLSLLPEGTAMELAAANAELTQIASKLGEAKRDLRKAQNQEVQRIRSAKELGISDRNPADKRLLDTINKDAEQKNRQRQLDIANAQRIITLQEQSANKISNEIGAKLDKIMFQAGVDNLTRSLEQALAQGSIVAAKSYLNVLKMAGGATARLEGQLEQQALNIQLDLIKAQYASVRQLELNTIAQEEANLLMQKAQSDLKGSARDIAFANIDKQLRVLANRKMVVNLPDKSQLALMKVAGANSNIPEEVATAVRDSMSLITTNVGKQRQEAGINAQKTAVGVTSKANEVVELAGLEKDRLQVAKQDLDTKLLANSEERKLIGIYTEQNQLQKEQLETAAAKKAYDATQLDIAAKITLAEQERNRYANNKNSDQFKSAQQAVDDNRNKAQAEYNRYVEESIARQNRFFDERFAGTEAVRQRDAEINTKAIKDASDLANIEITNTENKLNALQKLSYVYEGMLIDRQAALAVEKQESTYSVERNALETASLTTRLKLINDVNSALRAGKDAGPAIAALEAANDEYERQSQLLDARNSSVIEGIKLQQKANKELFKQEDFTKRLISLTESLALVFGKVGAGIGAALVVMNKMAIKETQYTKQKLATENRLAELNEKKKLDPNNIKMQAEIQKEIIERTEEQKKLEQEMAISQLQNISELSAAGKTMFKEKTAAYKVFDAIQKASAAAAMAIQVQQMAMEIAALPAKIAGGVSALFSQGGFAGFAGAAAFLALMASLGFSGGAKSVPSGFSAEDQQAVQGTGRSYKGGKVVENGGGALGDSEKKSTAIVDGIERLGDINFALLRYSKSAMYEALVDIRDNTEQFVKLLVSGLRLGGLGTSNSSSKSFLGFSKTSVSVKDKGVQIQGALGDLTEGGGTRRMYENVQTTKSSFWGLSKSTKNKTKFQEIDDIANEAINDIFNSFNDVILSATKTLGENTDSVQQILDSFNVELKVSSKGKTGEEFAADVMAAIGIQLDIAAKKAFPDLTELSNRFQDLGETTTDFIVRLVSTAEDVEYGLKSISKAFDKTNISSMAEFSQALVEVMGGVDKFVSQTEYFRDNFLSEAERLLPIQKALNEELDRLGLSFVDTREEFVAVVQALDITTTGGRQVYASLMQMAEAFAEVHDVTSDATSIEEKLADIRRQYVDILRLEGKLTQSVALERELELEEMQDYMRVGQKYIWAMEDQADLTERMTSAYERQSQEIKSTTQELEQQIDTLNKYKVSLKTGNDSTLMPEQKYQVTKAEYLKILTLANSVAVTDEQKQAKNQAITDLPNVASSFLEASKTLFASSVQYTADFNGVMDTITNTTASLEQTKSIAEQQLTVLERIYDSFNIVAESVDTVARLAPDLLLAQQQSLAASIEYYNKYPNGPVAPAAPAIVTVNNDAVVSVLNINNAALIAEVKALKDEISTMKAEANSQTVAVVAAVKNVSTTVATSTKQQMDAAAYAAFWLSSSP